VKYIVDASVVAKWVLPGEPYQVNAVKLKSDYVSGLVELSSPFLASVEVANAFRRAVRLGRLSEADAEEALVALGDLGVELHPLGWSRMARVLGVASELGLSVYDASYVSVAGEVKATLITSDDALYERAGKRCSVQHLRDY
jgi:predicted nucleic acid-binding protein